MDRKSRFDFSRQKSIVAMQGERDGLGFRNACVISANDGPEKLNGLRGS